MQLNQLETLKFGNIPKYFTEILGTLPKFLYLCTRDGSTKQVRPSQTGVGCTRKCRIYYHTANITLFVSTQNIFS